MSPLTSFLSKLFGFYCLLYALTMFAHRNVTIAEIQRVLGSPATILTLSVVLLAAGIAMVISHNVWKGGPATILVTVLGWVLLLKGLIVAFLTPQALGAYYDSLHYEDFFYVYAGVLLMLGAYLTHAGFTQTPRARA